MDFLTNKGQADKLNENMNIAQAEIHKSYYRYTMTIDLDQIGIDGEIALENKEKARRVKKLMDTVAFLYRDIRGRREDLKPLFVIGGVYDVKNPVFQNVVDVADNNIVIKNIKDLLTYEDIKENTRVGIIDGQFANSDEVKAELKAESVPAFFNDIKGKIDAYYESN